ncbi:hypothetical protein Pmar_PMAR008500 [Perkinsus marinus ATCC 50983]|uniref:Uncharacterized protein n=1 Tax=Perkinsus marinus (strain ATCC 50983 / TXsc) TaxID=423536 RepID=C5LKL4_PERM5|nr:hypothetical protein Pmar_PMAR008500 [Perkinsus marinus ATCC 50983]EER02729.1 hypothetical protein Pmar_PMAR008500 [Perkinsus marinus ATCC 50983]|eukprot:XP_002770913.1 hypothetical protein Pmar_PMAR008500 [Perkinsus marinus ATCC 50983]
MCALATRFYKIDFKDELTNTRLPKVLCDGCKRRLCRLRDNEVEQTEWEEHKRFYVSGAFWHYEPVKTRGTVICSAENRCKVCCIYAEKKSNTLQKKHSAAPQKGRPLQQSPPRPMCSKCGQYMDSEHDLGTCDSVKKRPRNSGAAGRRFSDRVDTRGYTDEMLRVNLKKKFLSSTSSSTASSSGPVRTGVSVDAHHALGLELTPVPYKATNVKKVELTTDAVRDLLRLGHLGLGKTSAKEMCRILRGQGIFFPEGGLQRALDEKWVVFGPVFAAETLSLQEDRQSSPGPTPFGFCTDVNSLLNTVTAGEADRITRLKFQLDGGQQFLKVSINVATMDPGSRYVPKPNSVLRNFVIGMGQASETHHNLSEVFNHRWIRSLFDMGIPKIIACDLKVAAIIAGIQPASSKYPCPFCLFMKGSVCDGQPSISRSWSQHLQDRKDGKHNVVEEPLVAWEESPMELLTLSPLHLLLGITNKLYDLACPAICLAGSQATG